MCKLADARKKQDYSAYLGHRVANFLKVVNSILQDNLFSYLYVFVSMNRTSIILLLMTALACNKIYAGNPNNVKQFINHSDWNFVENKGQLATSDIKYYGRQGGVNIYCKPGIISFVFTKTEKESDQISESTSQPSGSNSPLKRGLGGFSLARETEQKTTLNRADLILLNSNPTAQIFASEQQEYYENYYTTGNADSGIINVHTFKTITYKSIYPNIDLVLHSRENGMKYEFVVYPGGKVSDIQMQWNGLENMQMTENGGVEYAVAMGKMEESAPYSFVRADPFVRPDAPYSDAGRTHRSAPYKLACGEIESQFILKNNLIGFKTGKYDKSKTLVIDPTLVWGTYFGGTNYDNCSKIALDSNGYLYVCGETSSQNNIATSGAYQTANPVPNEVGFFAKFDTSGKIQWSTYYEGDYQSGIASLAIDNTGYLYIAGNTDSKSGIATTGAYQTSFGGFNGDAFLAKFTQNGVRIWATYYGGSGNDGADDVTIDKSGNVYITGITEGSPSGIATKGAYQTSYGSSQEDAFLAKFNQNGGILWATYFGGPGVDNGYSVATDVSGNVFIAGECESATGISTKGAYQTSYGGNDDGFLAKFDSTGKIQWSTYYGGGGAEDGADVAVDRSGNIFISGYTQSTTGISTKGAFQVSPDPSITNYPDGFLAKFSNSGTLLWSTYYGGNGADYLGGLTLDPIGNVYMSGSTSSTTNMATAGSYQPYYNGDEDGLLVKFDNNGNRIWATYFGGKGQDGIASVVLSRSSCIYIAGWSSSTSGIANSGGYQKIYGGSTDGFIAKISNSKRVDAGIDSFISLSGNYCKGTIPVLIRLQNFGLNELDSVKISMSINGILLPPYSWTGKLQADSTVVVNLGNIAFPAGTDTTKVWTFNPNGLKDSFPGNDTAFATIKTYPLPPANAGPDTILCYDETYTMRGSGGITYVWHPATYLSSAVDPNAIAILPNTERYELVVSNVYGCIDSAPVLLKVRPKLAVKAITLNNPVCYGNPVTINAIGTGGDSLHYKYQWVDDGATSDSLTEKAFQSGWHKVVLSDNCSPVSATDSVYVTVAQHVKAAFNWSPNPNSIEKRPVSFMNESSNAVSYLWTFGDNDSSKLVSPDHIYADTGHYRVMLIAYGLNNCYTDTAYVTVNILSNQISIFIPNAFSPNGDGVNDLFDISGVGIKSYTYNIYNRWGEHLFEATPGHTGWDGTFKGVQVPESIYIYQLDVTDIEGLHHYLSGNITLMR